MKFTEFDFDYDLMDGIDAMGYTTATPVQEQVIPHIIAGKDIIAAAQTGTGKTAAFLLPIIHKLLTQPHDAHNINAMVIVPTRELAVQITQILEGVTYYTSISFIAVYGGTGGALFANEKKALSSGVDIVICTPGRMISHLNMGYVKLDALKYLVLDEADRMLDMGFIHDVKRLITKLPQKRQTLFFSATMPPEIQKLANTLLNKPEKVEVTPISTTAETVTQSVYYVDKKDKRQLLNYVLEDKAITMALVFTRTKHGADKVVKDLEKAGIKAEAIHGNKSQNARQRALNNFKEGRIRVLIATDIAARGIDVDLLSHVINYEIPEVPETYVHRIGRTGRAGASGIAISFCDDEEMTDWRNILKLTGQKIPVIENHPFPMSASGKVQINLPKNKDVVHRPNAVPGRNASQGNRPRRNFSGGGGAPRGRS